MNPSEITPTHCAHGKEKIRSLQAAVSSRRMIFVKVTTLLPIGVLLATSHPGHTTRTFLHLQTTLMLRSKHESGFMALRDDFTSHPNGPCVLKALIQLKFHFNKTSSGELL
ncbi:uncharacterized protein LOC111272835 [Varroa jacobsoni]|uniref:uncharacterized protein LOC111272835 n=1 Tax=Varroa jacobsoni TaxID=62625 RepID=UPI000BF9B6E8|nr:uncharacterized protein LOC111272835 [Varroa jacobsoni]